MDGSQAPASPSVIHWPGAPGGGRLRLRVERVTEADVDAAFDVLADATHWLAQRGRRQRISRLTREVYGRWQREQGNFAVWAGTRIVGVFTLVREPLAEWPRVSIRGPVLWLRALATHPDHRAARSADAPSAWRRHWRRGRRTCTSIVSQRSSRRITPPWGSSRSRDR